MFSLSARFRKSRTAGAAGSVYYSIRKDKTERIVSGSVRGSDESVLSEAKEQIAFDLMTIYCVIEDLQKRNSDISLDDIVDSATKALLHNNPYKDRISHFGGKYPVCDDVAKISKLYSEYIERTKKSIANFDISTLQGFLSALIQEYAREGKPYAKSLRSTQISLDRYLDGRDMPFKDLTGSVVDGYKDYLYDKVTPSTASFYLRNLRTALIRAEREFLLPTDFTWPDNIKTNIPRPDHSPKNDGLDLKSIRMIEHLDLSTDRSLDLARDMFMFGFYTKGMELVDIAMLKRENLDGNTLIYKRRQKGKEHKVELGEKAMSIIEKYHSDNNEYLFPIIQRKWTYSYSSARNEFADSLKKIGMMLHLPVKLTFSMNIHSWQTIIKSSNIAEMLVS